MPKETKDVKEMKKFLGKVDASLVLEKAQNILKQLPILRKHRKLGKKENSYLLGLMEEDLSFDTGTPGAKREEVYILTDKSKNKLLSDLEKSRSKGDMDAERQAIDNILLVVRCVMDLATD